MTTIVTCFGEIMARIQPEGLTEFDKGFQAMQIFLSPARKRMWPFRSR